MVFGRPDRERHEGDRRPGKDGRRRENVNEGECVCVRVCNKGRVLEREADFLSLLGARLGFLGRCCDCERRICAFSESNSRCQTSSWRSATGAGCASKLDMLGMAEGGNEGDMGAEQGDIGVQAERDARGEGTYECLRSGLPAISSLWASSWCTAVLKRFQK
jgi:hypothetical protein